MTQMVQSVARARMISPSSILIKDKEEIIPFINMVNEISKVVEDEFMGDWITTHHNFLNKTPLDEFNESGVDRVIDLLSLIDIDEADIID